ncbi:hypothetical protein ACE1B6_27405 [Aerosakkonemataceae cyanobacterium BLCC-F154]|uniref:Type VI secretion system baseplate subunit TssG n=1 Tax=Floridaenema fluviatile BLCC-F154 TaxID=3153640 RepID=A0ABV4YJS2_9CYAN
MPLPPKESFENLLRSLIINKPKDLLDYKSIKAIDSQEAIDSNQEMLLPRYDLWYQENELTLNSLIIRVQKELEAKNHKASRDIVLIILCLYSLHKQKNEFPVDSFNEILSWVTNADLTQYYIFPKFKQPDDLLVDKFYLKLGSFEISQLDLSKIEYRCKKAKSNFFDKYQSNLQNRLAICRNFFSTKVINFISFKEKFYSASDTYKHIGNAYFTNLSYALFEDFWKSFLDEQHLFIALGAPYLHERNFQQFPLTEKLSIFLNIGGGSYGYVSSIQINIKSVLELYHFSVTMRLILLARLTMSIKDFRKNNYEILSASLWRIGISRCRFKDSSDCQ